MRHWKGSGQGGNPVLAGHVDGPENTTHMAVQGEQFNGSRSGPLGYDFASPADRVWGYFELDDFVTPCKTQGLVWPQVRAFQRWNEIKRLMKHRIAAGQVGWKDAHGWIAVIGNILSVTEEVTERAATVKNLEWFCGLMKMPPFEIAAYPFRNTDDVLLSPRAAGIALHLLKEERAELKIRTVDAEDEFKRDRQRRLSKESSERNRRKKGAKPRSESMAAKARSLGISVSTLKRRIGRGEPIT